MSGVRPPPCLFFFRRYTIERDPRINHQIRAREVRLIGENGEQIGVVDIRRALGLSEESGLDLVEISPNANPPVCKLVDFGKFKYEKRKREREAKKRQVVVQIKEIKLKPQIEDHDLNIKIKHIDGFLKEGKRVKISMRFRGREIIYKDHHRELLNKICEGTKESGAVESHPKMEGKSMIMMLVPK